MTASQQPDAEHAPLTSPAAAGSGPTGHDKAVRAVMGAMDGIEVWVGGLDDAGDDTYHGGTLDRDDLRTLAKAALRAARDHDRAALAAGDADVAEALGLRNRVVVDHEIGYFDENCKAVLQFGGTLHQCEDVLNRHPDWFRPDSRILVKRSTWWQSNPVGRWEVSGE